MEHQSPDGAARPVRSSGAEEQHLDVEEEGFDAEGAVARSLIAQADRLGERRVVLRQPAHHAVRGLLRDVLIGRIVGARGEHQDQPDHAVARVACGHLSVEIPLELRNPPERITVDGATGMVSGRYCGSRPRGCAEAVGEADARRSPISSGWS